MKKVVTICGLISGLILMAVMLISSTMMYDDPDFKGSMVLGFGSMILSFSLIFVGIKNYRDKYNGGTVSFGKAFMVGFYICLIASTMYVIGWLINLYMFIPDFMDKYSALSIRELQTQNLSTDEMKVELGKVEWLKEKYKSPIWVIMLTYMEVFPLGVFICLVAALIFKRKQAIQSVN